MRRNGLAAESRQTECSTGTEAQSKALVALYAEWLEERESQRAEGDQRKGPGANGQCDPSPGLALPLRSVQEAALVRLKRMLKKPKAD